MGDRADEAGDGMLCVDHPYRSNPGGVCAFCLQEKLGELVSSSKSTHFKHSPSSSSSSSSPSSFRPDLAGGWVVGHDGADIGRGTKFPFLADGHSEKKKGGRNLVACGTTHATASIAVAKNVGGLGLKRSKSVAPRRIGSSFAQVGDGGGRSNGETAAAAADCPRKKSFWSFLYHSSVSSASTSSAAANGNINRRRSISSSSGGVCNGHSTKQRQRPPRPTSTALDKLEATHGTPIQMGQNGGGKESPSGVQASSSFGRKVARSRSVGCGSRSFSGDFLEHISTGLGDCTLRRVESQREAKPKSTLHLDTDGDPHRPRMKERVKCGGLFGGFGMMSSFWLSAAAGAPDEDFDGGLRTSAATPGARAGVTPHGRTRSWDLAFPSPMRAFRPYTSTSRSTSKLISSINASHKLVNGAAPFLSVQS